MKILLIMAVLAVGCGDAGPDCTLEDLGGHVVEAICDGETSYWALADTWQEGLVETTGPVACNDENTERVCGGYENE